MSRPLEGIRVADFSENLAGPFCTRILGDLGADVTKVERPGGGDPARRWGPPFWGRDGLIFHVANASKRSLVVDLKADAGREVARRLVERADVLVQSFRAGVIEALGLGCEEVRRRHPALVYCSVTSFGTEGPLRELPGYDPLMQAYAGIMAMTGHPDGPPARAGTSVVDIGTGLWAAVGILAALRERDRTGEGAHVTTSLFDTALTWISYHLLGYVATGEIPERQGTGLGMISPYGAFPTADGSLMIAAGTDGLFGRLCGALGLDSLAGDPRFADNASRVANRSELEERLAAATRRAPTRALEARLREAAVPCAPILGVDEVAREPQTEAAGIFGAVPHPGIEGYRNVALPLRTGGERPEIRRVPPRPGEHGREVLRELGYSPGEISALRSSGVIEVP